MARLGILLWRLGERHECLDHDDAGLRLDGHNKHHVVRILVLIVLW